MLLYLDRIQSPILRRIAEGDLSAIYDINENNAGITENIQPYGLFINLLTAAVYNGHTAIVKRLLAKKEDGSYEFTAVIENIVANYNITLRLAAQYGHIEIVNRLLAKNDDGSYEFPDVIQNIAADDNFALRFAYENGHIEVVNRLLAKNDDGSYEFLSVVQNITARGNYALCWAAFFGQIVVVNRLLAKMMMALISFQRLLKILQ